MDCKHVEEKLPAYLEGALPPDEKKLVGGHVAACPGCRAALEDLVKTERLIRDLEEAEPPAWLKQRIMAKVRGERERREGFFRKIFHPLHIKVPATALATVLIAVFAVYVFRTVEPETQYLHRVPAEPAPLVPEKIAPGPREATPQKAIIPEARGDKGRTALSETDRGEGRRRMPHESKPAEQPFPERKVAERQEEAPPGVATGAADRRTPSAKGAMAPAGKEEALYGTAMRDEVRAPAVAAKIKAASQDRPGYAYSLYASDPAAAVKDVESILSGSGARKIAREFRDGKGLVTAEIDAGKASEILKRLESLGEVRGRDRTHELPAGLLVIRIEVLPRP